MPTNTFVALDKKTITTAVASVEFVSVPQGYTDLVLVMNGNTDSATTTKLNVGNGSIDTGSNYSWTVLSGTGSAANSYRESNVTFTQNERYANYDATNNANTIISLQNYSNATTYKTWLSRGNNAAAGVDAIVGLWRNTSAINIIRVSCTNAGRTFAVGSTFSLYGIKAWTPEVTPKATGGYVYEDSSYWYHAFPFSGTFTPNQSLTADCLVIAGGGGGSGWDYAGGGGGAGGLLAHTSESLIATNYTVTIGAGGAGNSTNGSPGVDGSNSQFASLTASVGGGGGGASANANSVGRPGGSGGGAGVGGSNGGAGTSGQGNNGGVGYGGEKYTGGGGGGKGAVGGNGSATNGGIGGTGVNTYSSWASVTGTGVSGYYAGGGGGGVYAPYGGGDVPGTGGAGGGGAGATGLTTPSPTSGTPYTGGGGGGAGANQNGGAGGSGIVIVRYAK